MTEFADNNIKIAEINNQNEFHNATNDFFNQIGHNIDENERAEIENQLDATFFNKLEEGLHPDTAQQLKTSIEKINGYQQNEQLKTLYEFVDGICNLFAKTEHTINNSFNIETAPDGAITQLKTLINGNNNGYKGLAELNAIANDNTISPLITAVKGILDKGTISGNHLVNIANFLHIDTSRDKKYNNRERRLNNLGKEVFGTGEHSLLRYLESKRPTLIAEYQETFIPTTFDNDFLLENQFLQYSPVLSGDTNGKIEFRKNDDISELGTFYDNGNLKEGTRYKINNLQSGIFDENGNLKEGCIINANGILIGAFNYDQKQGIVVNGEISPDDPDALIQGEGIRYDIDNQNIFFVDRNRNEVNINNYTYNAENNTITLNITNSPVTIHTNGANREKLIFDFLIQHDPMNLIDNNVKAQLNNTSPTIFQQFCTNNGIDFNTTQLKIREGQNIIDQENKNFLNSLDITDILKIEKITTRYDQNNIKGEFSISDDIMTYDGPYGDNLQLTRYRIDNNKSKIQYLNRNFEWQDFDFTQRFIERWREPYIELDNGLKIAQEFQLKQLILDNGFEQKWINDINTKINGTTNPDDISKKIDESLRKMSDTDFNNMKNLLGEKMFIESDGTYDLGKVKEYLTTLKDTPRSTLKNMFGKPEGRARISAVQIMLNEKTGENGTKIRVDGICGPETRDRIRNFQGQNGITQDRQPGKDTISKLLE